MKGKTALLFGASGLVGSHLLEELIHDNNYTSIKLFSRKHIEISNSKVIQYVVNFNRLEEFSALMTGDVMFCCLGTTIGKVGSQIAFRNVDYVIPVKLAYIAKKNYIDKFLVVSSIGANKNSNKFYLKTKGEMEASVIQSGVYKIGIIRPSLLLGKREEFRFGETLFKALSPIMNIFLQGSLRKYRGIQAEQVARAMLEIAETLESVKYFESQELENY